MIEIKTVFRSGVAVFAIVALIFLSQLRINVSWNFAITDQQHENHWTLPAVNSSLTMFVNSSIDVYIDLKQFRQHLKEQNKNCRSLQEDPFTMFKSQPSSTTKFTAEIDKSRMELAFVCGGALYPEFLTEPPKEDLYPFEAFYLSDPPLWDESTVASHEHSTINLYGPNNTFVVGDSVSVVIKMFDRKGRPRLKGGDRLKVWLKDVQFKHSISANITDFNNGTYLATTVLAWAGSVRVMATLRQSREFFRALAYVHRALKSTMPFFGAFANSQANETVPCGSVPLVPGYQKSELCNLTVDNGSPWYCGRPSKPELNCSDYGFITYLKMPMAMPVSSVEDTLLKQQHFQNYFLPGTITLNVEATKSGLPRLSDPNVPCNKVSPRSTWHQSEPTGYFYHNVWKPFLCFLPDKPEKVNESCLKNVHMIFYGDSNAREFYNRIKSKLQCNETVYGSRSQPYHAPKVCINNDYNYSIQHLSHANPFHAGWNKEFVSVDYLHSPERLFGSIPSNGRYIIVLSHYLHYTTHHISVYEAALKAIRDAIVRLLKRNPQVLILLRGPHVAEEPPYVYYLGDVWAQYFITLQKETFRDLQDHILYFPTWDITVASEDITIHPLCNDHLSDVMFQFMQRSMIFHMM